MPSHAPVRLLGRGTLHFKRFETWRIEEFLEVSKEHSLVADHHVIGATGGGARKYGPKFLEVAGLKLHKADELSSLVRGVDFLARHAVDDCFEYPQGTYKGGVHQRPLDSSSETSSDEDEDHNRGCKEEPVSNSGPAMESGTKTARRPRPRTLSGVVGDNKLFGQDNAYPYLVVNIGSGVSILRVDSANQFERVGGTSLGGSTFLGLTLALTGCSSFDEAIDLASHGDSTQIDMLVGDIYGGNYPEMGLAATTVASSFGKLVQPKGKNGTNGGMSEACHLAKAALLMVTNNIGSIAMLHAKSAGVRTILFAGSFLYSNKLAMRLLAVAVEFWSKGSMKAVFMRHEAHAGAVGALLGVLDGSALADDASEHVN
eukprot:SM000016S01917  [mRNA]  locus=s16:582536:585921:- [translate_table: standard]